MAKGQRKVEKFFEIAQRHEPVAIVRTLLNALYKKCPSEALFMRGYITGLYDRIRELEDCLPKHKKPNGPVKH